MSQKDLSLLETIDRMADLAVAAVEPGAKRARLDPAFVALVKMLNKDMATSDIARALRVPHERVARAALMP